MKEVLPESTKRLRKIGLGIFVVLSLLGGLLIWQVDLFHLHFGYRDAKEEYLRSGMPWTSEDLYSSITPEQATKREELVESVGKVLKSYRLDSEHRYENVSKENAANQLQKLAPVNVHIDRIVALSDAPLLGLVDLTEGFHFETTSVAEMKRAIQVLAIRGEWRVTVGRFEDGKKDLEAAYRLANSLGNSEYVGGYLVGNASVVTVDQSIVKAAGAVKGKLAQFKELEGLMQKFHSSYPLPINALKGEALVHLAYARNADILKDISSLMFQDGFPGAVTEPTMKSGDPRTMGRRSLSVAFMQLSAGVGDSIKKNPKDYEEWLAALKSETIIAVKRGGMSGNMINFWGVDADQFLDYVKRSKTLRLVNLSLLRGTRMNLEGRSQGDIESAMEIDPYSGQPLVWKSTGSTFTVWSVGPNGADDGGISRADYRKLMGSGSTKVGGVEPYDVPATIPWKPEPNPSSAGYSHLSGEDR